MEHSDGIYGSLVKKVYLVVRHAVGKLSTLFHGTEDETGKRIVESEQKQFHMQIKLERPTMQPIRNSLRHSVGYASAENIYTHHPNPIDNTQVSLPQTSEPLHD